MPTTRSRSTSRGRKAAASPARSKSAAKKRALPAGVTHAQYAAAEARYAKNSTALGGWDERSVEEIAHAIAELDKSYEDRDAASAAAAAKHASGVVRAYERSTRALPSGVRWHAARKALKGYRASAGTFADKVHAFSADMTKTLRGVLRTNGLLQVKTWDNGGHPFEVSVERASESAVDVVVRGHVLLDARTSKYDDYARRLVTMRGVDAVFFGQGSYDAVNEDKLDYVGNNVLVVKGRTVTRIGDSIQSFTLRAGEHVTDFVSTVGNSGAPYMFVRTNQRFVSFGCHDAWAPLSVVKGSFTTEAALSELQCPSKGAPWTAMTFTTVVPRQF